MFDRLSKYFYQSRQFKQFLGLFLLSLFIVLVPLGNFPFTSVASETTLKSELAIDTQHLSLIEQGRLSYEAGKYTEAIQILQSAIQQYQEPEAPLRMAMVHNNLALAFQKLGQDTQAQDNLRESLKLINNTAQSKERSLIIAQNFDIRGNIALNHGKAEEAWNNWEQAAINYEAANHQIGVVRSRLNGAQALQSLGFYRRAVKILESITTDNLAELDRAVIWRSLGNTFLALGKFPQAESALKTSLDLAKASGSQSDLSAAYFSLANLARSQQNYPQATADYQQAIKTAPDLTAEVRARLNLLNVLIINQQDFQTQLNLIKPLIAQLPLNRFGLYAKINYAQTSLKIPQKVERDGIAEVLQKATAEARQLQDRPAEAYSLQTLARLYELEAKWQPAEQLTQQALYIAQSIDARDIAYQGQWQLGRIYQQQGEAAKAIAAYQQAVELLQSLRSDLVAVNSEVQFTFRESVEPIYREYISLLLNSADPSENNLIAARTALDSLQLAELENFFHATCLEAQSVVIDKLIDQEDTTTAIIYPIVLADRFEIILKLPQQPLLHYTTPIERPEKVERILARLSQTLTQRNSRETLPLAQLVYSWIIQPAAVDLANSQVNTLVFVLDSPLRNIPMSVLHDGQQYLIEKYAIAITPGLQLIQPQAIAKRQLTALTAGLTAGRSGFPPLEYVTQELQTIESQIATTQQLVNQDFANNALQEQITQTSFPVVHLATHGQFSSEAEETFILTWDGQINVNQLSELLQITNQDEPIELLVLSACETLAGDRRAALGLAGVAVKAGARSTLATLWRVNDQATALLMEQFYRELAVPNRSVTKAEALRHAQLTLLKSDRFESPHFWSSAVLVGNWF